MTTETCEHVNIRTEVERHLQSRFIPSGWERESDDNYFETVMLTDRHYFCADCGEYLDSELGD